MFAPEGYLGFSKMTNFLRDWAYRVYLAYLLEADGKYLEKVFTSENSAERLLSNFRHVKLREAAPNLKYSDNDKNWVNHIKQGSEDSFFVAVLFHCLLAKVLMNFQTLVASPDGKIVEPDNYLFIHMDRLDWVDPTWPIRESGGLWNYMDYFDQGKFDGFSVSERYCFLDFSLGTIGLKNNSARSFLQASHFGTDELSKRYISTQVEHFVGWAVVWKEDDLPEDYTQFFEDVGFLETRWNVPTLFSSENEANSPARKRGAKPSGAKAEYYRLYPKGKPDGLSYDAIAAELAERGFAVVGRTVLNYENARNRS